MTDFLELNPASDNCQRWNARQHSWRHTSEGGFDPDRYTVEPIDRLTAQEFVITNHYSASYPSCKFRLGLFDDANELVGALIYSTPVQNAVLTKVFPELEPSVESIELGRLVLLDEVPANAESWFVARCAEYAAARGMRGVVSFADPVPRLLGDRVIMPGHVGCVYQSSNAIYLGRSTPETADILPNGKVFNNKAKSKIRKQERGHGYAERQLIALGAKPMRAGESPHAWLAQALADVGSVKVRHRGKHRYGFAIGSKSQRRRLHIAGTPRPYPKEVDAA